MRRGAALLGALAACAGCESLLDIPVGIRGSDRYACDAQQCTCTCGYVRCEPDAETCDSQCSSRSFVPPPPSPSSYLSTPTLLVSAETAYVAFLGQASTGHGLVCRRAARAGSSTPPQCAPCEHAILGDVSLAAFAGSLYVAGRQGACVFRLPDFTREADLLPQPGRDFAGFTTDVERNELVWLEHKPGQKVSVFRRGAQGDPTTVELAAWNRPNLVRAAGGKLAWKVVHASAEGCDDLYLGADNKDTDACLVTLADPSAEIVVQTKLPPGETLQAMSFVGGSLYYATRHQGDGSAPAQAAPSILGTVRRSEGPNLAQDPVLASSATVITEIAVLPEEGEIQLFYGTLGGVLYGGPVRPGAAPGAAIVALTGFGDSTQITALSALKDTLHGGYLTFFNGRVTGPDGGALVPELRQLAVAPAGCQ